MTGIPGASYCGDLESQESAPQTRHQSILKI